MFLWRRDAIRGALETWAPDVAAAVARGLADGDVATAYATITPRSIDYAVMEPAATAGRVLMASMDVGWTDVGTWSVLLEVLGAAGIEAGVVEAGDRDADAGRRPRRSTGTIGALPCVRQRTIR